MLAEYTRLEEKILDLQSELESFPDGKLICVNNGQHFKWFHSDGHTQTYIPKKQREYAEQLAVKKYLATQLKSCEHEKAAIEYYLRHHSTNSHSAEELLQPHCGYYELLSPYFKTFSEELTDWMNSPFEMNTSYPELLIHKTISGNLVRSKSESLIDMALYVHKIPFRYECALNLGSITLYPDFTLRHPQTGDFFYWEHFGLMDDTSYSQNVCSKLQLYTSCGIIPGVHLITTYETKDFPLSTETIEKTINYYFG